MTELDAHRAEIHDTIGVRDAWDLAYDEEEAENGEDEVESENMDILESENF